MAIANVTLTNTFDEWRTRTNELIVEVNNLDVFVPDLSTKTNTIYIYANTINDKANAGYVQANTARTHANAAHLTANAGLIQANTARDQANAAFAQANIVFGAANAGLIQANTARDHANIAYNQANTGRTQGNTAFVQANLAFSQANLVFGAANAGLIQANTARDHANIAYAQANTARTHANAAFLRANTITTAQIENAAVTTDKIAANAVDGTKIALGSDAQGDLMYYDGTNWVKLPAGTSGQFLATNGAAANPEWITPSYAPDVIIQDQKAQNADGGTFGPSTPTTTGQQRVLNTLVRNVDDICTLASNQFTLPAGTYYIEWSAPAAAVNSHQSWLNNVTAGSVSIRGTSEYAGTGALMTTRSFGSGVFINASSTTYEIRHRCTTTRSTDGFGVAANFGTEIYTEVKIWKIPG